MSPASHQPEEPEILAAPTKRKRKPHQWALMLLGPVLLVVILSLLDSDQLLAALGRVDAPLFFAASTSLLITVVLRTWRWQLLLDDVTPTTPNYWDLLMIYAYSIYVGVATPGRVGEFVKAFHLNNMGVNAGTAMANVLTDRMMDVATLLLIAAVSFVVIVIPGKQNELVVAGLVAVLIAAMAGGWWLLRSERLDGLFERLREVKFGPLRKLFDRFYTLGRDFRDAVRRQKVRTLWISLIPTLVSFVIVYGANYYIARSIGIELGYFDIVAVSAVTSLAAQLPITVLGVGTREAAMIVVMSKYGVSEEDAVVLSVLFLASVIYVALVCALSMVSSAVRFARSKTNE